MAFAVSRGGGPVAKVACGLCGTYMAFDIAAAEPVELFLELNRLDMLRDVADEQTHLGCGFSFSWLK